MSYFVLMGRRIPKQAITGFRFQNETDNIRPFLSIRIRGKEEIIPFKDKREILSVKAHLCSVFSKFVKIGDWYLKMSEVKEYKPVTAEDMNPYILFKTSKFGNIKVRFQKDEDMNAELANSKYTEYLSACDKVAKAAQKHINWNNNVGCAYIPGDGLCVEIEAHVCPVTRFFELPEIIGNDMIDEYTYRTNCI
nr:MAG: hypothetical protein [Bacteriophage sp.]